MKKLFPLAVLSLVLFSCNSGGGIAGHYIMPRLDTVHKAFYKIQHPVTGKLIGPFVDTAINQMITTLKLKDTFHNTGAAWVTDTISYGRVSADTMRDKLGKPLFDSAHHARFSYGYYLIPKGYMLNIDPRFSDSVLKTLSAPDTLKH